MDRAREKCPRTLLRCVALLLLLAGCWAGPAWAGDFTDEASIRAAVADAMGEGVSPADVAVDSRLRLAACRRPLTVLPSGGRSAEVRCDDNPGWKLFVPVQRRQEGEVVVLRTPARAGVPLDAAQLAVQRRDLVGVAGTGFARIDDVVGRVPKRGLAPGAILLAADLASSVRLKRGDPVVLVSRQGGIEVRVQGRALGPAADGGTVSVENVASRRVVRGRLVADGVVEVGL